MFVFYFCLIDIKMVVSFFYLFVLTVSLYAQLVIAIKLVDRR